MGSSSRRQLWTADTACNGCPCTAYKCENRVGAARDKVSRLLQAASKQDLNDRRNRFIPRLAIIEIFSYEAVCQLLRTFFGQTYDLSESAMQKLAAYISPEDRSCDCKIELCTGTRLLFATLILLGKELQIQDFHQHANRTKWVCDDNLQNMNVDLVNNLGLAKVADTWSTDEKEIFCQLQWRMRSPFFKRFSPGSYRYYHLDDEVTLPWIEPELREATIESSQQPQYAKALDQGQFSFVKRIKIHPYHHALGRSKDDFALKVLKKPILLDGDPDEADKNHLRREVQANERIGQPHERIATLLTAFRHKDISYLVFPWAQGGNLTDLWKSIDPSQSPRPENFSRWCSVDWLWDQCQGIAEGLAYIHGFAGISNGQIRPVAQLHADVKPENILAFSTALENGVESYILKLADFGLSLTVDPEGQLPIGNIRHTTTYRPPDKDSGATKRVGLRWDVWCLGGVYLEFITWFLCGHDGVTRFEDARIEEHNQRARSTMETVEDNFFRMRAEKAYLLRAMGLCKRKSAELKVSVTSQIQYLGNHNGCDENLRKILGLIRDQMLVVREDGRATAAKLEEYLRLNKGTYAGA